MGRRLYSYPDRRCDVFKRDANEYHNDAVAVEWSRIDSFDGLSLFVGVNTPFFLKTPDSAIAAVAAEEAEAAAAAVAGGGDEVGEEPVGAGDGDEEGEGPAGAVAADGDDAGAEDGEFQDGEAAGDDDEQPPGGEDEQPAVVEEVPQKEPVFRPDCLYASHPSVFDFDPQQEPTWSRMHVRGGAAIGGSLGIRRYHGDEISGEAPMWFVPSLPPSPN